MKREYKNHFIAMISVLIGYTCILFAGFVVWNISCKKMVYPFYRELECVNGATYSYVIESNYDYGKYIRFKKLSNIIMLKNKNGKSANENVYIPIETEEMSEWNVEPGEIAISEKVAQKMSCDINSQVYLDFPIYDHEMEYEVVSFLPYASNLYEVLENLDFSYVVVGDDGTLFNQAKGTIIYLLNEQEYNEYMLNEYSYVSRHYLVQECEKLDIQVKFRYVVMLISLLILTIPVSIILHQKISREVLKYYYDGYPVDIVKRIECMDHLIFYDLPLILQVTYIISGLGKMHYSTSFVVCVIVLLTVMLFTTVLIGGRKYGKAS